MTDTTSKNHDRHDSEARAPRRKSFAKAALVVIGSLSVILGTVGIFVPLLPTTPFLLLAGACFARSSDRLYQWLINHRWFGTYIRNYREHRAITLPTKVLAIILLWSSMSYTGLAIVESWLVRGLLLVTAIGVTVHLVRLKTLKPVQRRGRIGSTGTDSRPRPTACDEGEPRASPDGA